jgi:hypothetical protein
VNKKARQGSGLSRRLGSSLLPASVMPRRKPFQRTASQWLTSLFHYYGTWKQTAQKLQVSTRTLDYWRQHHHSEKIEQRVLKLAKKVTSTQYSLIFLFFTVSDEYRVKIFTKRGFKGIQRFRRALEKRLGEVVYFNYWRYLPNENKKKKKRIIKKLRKIIQDLIENGSEVDDFDLIAIE